MLCEGMLCQVQSQEVYSTLQRLHQVSSARGKVFIISMDLGEAIRQCTPYRVLRALVNGEGFQGNGYNSGRPARGPVFSRSMIEI